LMSDNDLFDKGTHTYSNIFPFIGITYDMAIMGC